VEFLRERFPRIFETCMRFGLDLGKDMAPVHPAAHYAMGGIRTDLEGRTSVPRLYAAGEVASTGVHGANRLASNSLLEGVVFGARAGAAMRECAGAPLLEPAPSSEPRFPCAAAEELRALAWDSCGILRNGPALEEAIHRLAAVPQQPTANPNRELFELRSLHIVIELIARCALARRESRGAHYRTDFPGQRPEFQKHSLVTKDQDVAFS
jgi:L-aspartate oxidase